MSEYGTERKEILIDIELCKLQDLPGRQDDLMNPETLHKL